MYPSWARMFLPGLQTVTSPAQAVLNRCEQNWPKTLPQMSHKAVTCMTGLTFWRHSGRRPKVSKTLLFFTFIHFGGIWAKLWVTFRATAVNILGGIWADTFYTFWRHSGGHFGQRFGRRRATAFGCAAPWAALPKAPRCTNRPFARCPDAIQICGRDSGSNILAGFAPQPPPKN